MLSVKALFTEYPNERGETVKAAQDVSFDVPEGKLFTLLGPSGCGKTTTLRSIAGLERPRSGEISIGERVVYSSGRNIFVAPNRRNFGMVFQSYAIWPHMSVFKNAAFPLEVASARVNRAEIDRKVMRVLGTVGLDHLASREATKLSGGQQQRLALARALTMEPKLLLLDEPLSNLDAKLRERMRFELKRLQRELRLTTVYVTHDQGEALALSHEIAVMNEGRIVQIGAPRDIYERPHNRFVADFVGSANFLEATVIGRDDRADIYQVQTAIGNLLAFAVEPLKPGDGVVISLRPEDTQLSAHRPDTLNAFEGVVEAKLFLGEFIEFQIKLGDMLMLARVHPSFSPQVGTKVYIGMNPEKCVAIPDDARHRKA
ncbi:MAG: Fe3+/spermidine/putrescine ABC transporter ATP-binding protein [Betaproteobacteria bacterium RIFCSPLOWO2_02_FULL_63_19]|nr:MAG: Fe3+/spermidine/putrescine ABC transporter ATP-binding protein [Betaproteobacteria bacterium RIFCSPLOWO2_02_FULL_63_19]